MQRILMVAVLIACAAALLTACAPSAAPTADEAAAAAPAAASSNAFAGTPLAPLGRDLKRAKAVQAAVDAQAKKQAKAIDDASDGGH